jgi:hypothetical protein
MDLGMAESPQMNSLFEENSRACKKTKNKLQKCLKIIVIEHKFPLGSR